MLWSFIFFFLWPWCACDVFGERPSLLQAVVIPSHILSRLACVWCPSALSSQQKQTADDESHGVYLKPWESGSLACCVLSAESCSRA